MINNIKKIINVYRLEYFDLLTNQYKKSRGLGDFLRGCLFYIYLCELNNIEFDIYIDHPISKYIDNTNRTLYKQDKVYFIDNIHSYKGNIEILSLCNNKNCFISGNPNVSRTLFYKKHLDFINSKIQPNELMKNYINFSLNKLNLKKKEYSIIHIRIGDEYMNYSIDKQITLQILKHLKNKINDNNKYIIISDSNYIKTILKQFKNFYIIIHQIEHLGGSHIKNTTNDGVMNTMLDYYLMSYSNSIYAIGKYKWISGFSKWCSVLNNIPYDSIRLII